MMYWLVTAIVLLCLPLILCHRQEEGPHPQDNVRVMVNQSVHLQRSRRTSPVKAPACYFPFIANGISYGSCTMAGQNRAYWCSNTDDFDRDGKWSWCNGPGFNSYLACVFPFQYQGTLHYGCVLSSSGYTWCSTTSNYDLDANAIYCLEVDFKISSASAVSGTIMSSLLAETTTESPITTEPMSSTTSLSPWTTVSTVSKDTAAKTTLPARETSQTSVPTTLPDTSLRPLSSIPSMRDIGSTDTQIPAGTSGSTQATLPITIPTSDSSGSLTTSSFTSSTTSSSTSSTISSSSSTSSSSTSYNLTDTRQLTEWLRNVSLNLPTESGLDIIPDLQKYISSVSPSGFQKDEEELILHILGNITENVAQSNMSFPVSTVMDVLSIVNEILNNTFNDNLVFGPQFLLCFENILESMEMVNVSFFTSYDNFEFHCLAAPCVNMSDGNGLSIKPHVSIALPSEHTNQTFQSTCMVNVLLLSCKTYKMNFPDQYGEDGSSSFTFKVGSSTLTNVLRIDDKSYHNPNVNLTFPCSSGNYCDPTSICAFWDFTTSMWSSEGCTTEIDNGVTHCYCRHLTSFSVLFAKYIPSGLKNSSVLDYITIAGLSISIASLILCIAFQVYLLRFPMNLVAYYRHTTILNISTFLLLSNVSFIAASFVTPKEYLRLCVGLTFCTHFSLLAFFCWTLIQSLYLFCRLMFVFHHITKKEFMSLSVGLGYICPSVIAVGTFLYYSPTDDYQKDNVCWLDANSGASMAFSIPTIIILSGNFLILLVVIRKILRPSISEGSRDDEEVIKKLMKAVVFCTPQFGLTWAVGIPLMSDGSSVALHYLFVILNPLQGFFIFIFGCLLDKKVMNLIKKRMSKGPAFSSMATTVSSY